MIEKTQLEGVYLFKLPQYKDERGLFFEGFRSLWAKDCNVKYDKCQMNISHSKKNVVRGLHYQLDPPQAKYIIPLKGKIKDVALNIKKESKQYGVYQSFYLDSTKGDALLIPKGYAHGFSALSSEVILCYICDNYYNPNSDCGIYPLDPHLDIDWEVKDILLSPKDKHAPKWHELSSKQTF